MTRHEIVYGDPEDPKKSIVDADHVNIQPLNADGARKLTASEEVEGDDTPEDKFEITVGPDHVLGYEVQD